DLRVEAPDAVDGEAAPDAQTAPKRECLAEIAARPAPGDDLPRIDLRFHAAPVEIIGDSGVEGLRVVRTDTVVDADGRTRVVPRTPDSDSEETIPAGLVLTSVGYRGVPVPGVPFDPDSATIPHREGRVLDSPGGPEVDGDRKSTRLNSSHVSTSYAVFCLKK